jgi:dTMP kinase
MAAKHCYAEPPPGVDPGDLTGALIVVEGSDGSGRSTHVQLLTEWLERRGYPVARSGLTRSELVRAELDQAKLGNVLSPRTMSLFYATDFYDQLENVIVPALRAGSVVLADRYIFTLMARDRVRGTEPEWLESLYSRAVAPDAVFYLSVSNDTLCERILTVHDSLDYWESGMDLGLSRDWFESFRQYQSLLRTEYAALGDRYGFHTIDADRSLHETQLSLQDALDGLLDEAYEAPGEPRQLRIPKAPPFLNLEVS